MQPKTIDLETFLRDLPEEEAAKAKAAAARIDELERAAQRIGASDRRYLLMFAAAGVCSLAAAFLALGGTQLFSGGHATFTDLVVVLMAASFPVLVLGYSLRMAERTKIDRQKFDIIETYFLPHDAIYLPSGPDREHGVITITQKPGGWSRAPDKGFRRPGRYW